MDLVLIRHGLPVRVEGASGPADPALSEAGLAQAHAVARWLADERLDAVYASPLRRAVQTAAPVAERFGLEVRVEDGVAEFDRHADSYVPMEELKAAGDPRWAEIVTGGYFADSPFTAEEFQATVVEAIDRIVAAHPGEAVAVVCHGGVMNVFAAHVLGLAPDMFFEPAYTGICRIRASSRGHRSIVSLNETAHLRGL